MGCDEQYDRAYRNEVAVRKDPRVEDWLTRLQELHDDSKTPLVFTEVLTALLRGELSMTITNAR